MILSSLNELRTLVKGLKAQGKVVGLTSGCFDLWHFYHWVYLERCKAHCDFLVLFVDSDDMVFHFKNKRPVIPDYHRAVLLGLSGMNCVDAVFIMRRLDDFGEATKLADKVFKNMPVLYGKKALGAEKLVVVEDVIEKQSTSEIIASIQAALTGVRAKVGHHRAPRLPKRHPAKSRRRGPCRPKVPSRLRR